MWNKKAIHIIMSVKFYQSTYHGISGNYNALALMLQSTFLLCLQLTIKTVRVVLYVAGQNNMHLYLVLIVIAIETNTMVFTASIHYAKNKKFFCCKVLTLILTVVLLIMWNNLTLLSIWYERLWLYLKCFGESNCQVCGQICLQLLISILCLNHFRLIDWAVQKEHELVVYVVHS